VRIIEKIRLRVAQWREGNFLVVIVAAILATVLTYLLVWLLTPARSYVRDLFYERSWIQYASTFCFWLTMAILILKHLAYRYERAAYEVGRNLMGKLDSGATLTWAETDTVRERFVDKNLQAYQRSLTFNRISNAMERLRKTQSTSAMEDYLRTRSDIDGSELESSYADIRYLTWLIPTLGFIGTVMGIGVGIAGFSQIIETARGFEEIRKALPTVTLALGTAFDTTLLALGLSAVVVFYMSALLKREEQLLEKVDHLCFDGVCAIFREHSTASAEIVQALADKVDFIVDRNAGNRASVEQVLRHELPVLLSQQLTQLMQAIALQLAELSQVSRQLAAAQNAHNQIRQDVRDELARHLTPQLNALEQLNALNRDFLAQLKSIAQNTSQMAAGQEKAAELRETKVVPREKAREEI